jgi:hydroxymethylglutaryl-CoA lyase
MAQMVALREVGLRDGLQLAKSKLSTDTKVEWADRVARAGVPEIEVTSFVPPHVVPQFADSKELVGRLGYLADITVSALVPNLKGAKLAAEAGCMHVNFVMSVSEAHNLANVRKTVAID